MSNAATVKPQIGVSQPGIGSILRTNTLKVPSHQREYSWKYDDEVIEFFQDIMRAITDNEPSYFLGTIVTVPTGHNELQVIDGQQRLATTAILLSQMRRYLLAKGDTQDEVITDDLQDFLVYKDRDNRARIPRLTMNLADNRFFADMLSKNPPKSVSEHSPISHKLIFKAFSAAEQFVKKIVAGLNPRDHGHILNKWISYIEHRAEVILLQVPATVNCYKMFETLNDRGLATTQADLVKNYVFSEAGTERLHEAENAWSTMRSSLSSLRVNEKDDATVTFLRHALIALTGFLRKDAVLDVVHKIVKGPPSAVAFLGRMENLAGIYLATFYRDHEKWNKYPDAMRQSIHTVNFFNIHPLRPLLLAVAAKFQQKQATQAFQNLISLGVRLVIASSTRSGVIEETFAAVAYKVYQGKVTTASALMRELKGIVPLDEQFRQAFEGASVSKAPFARYYLRALEKVAKQQPDPWFLVNDDKEVITLEHVLPEKPEGNWPQFTDEEVEAFCTRLGNLALLHVKDNSDLKSADDKTKFKVYKDCPYQLTSQIAKVPHWTPETICKRQKLLAGLAVKAWPLKIK